MDKSGLYLELQISRLPGGGVELRVWPGKLLPDEAVRHVEQAGRELAAAVKCLAREEPAQTNKIRAVVPIEEG